MMGLGAVAAAIGKGLFAGLFGTVMMTISSTLEMKIRNRGASMVPAAAAAKVLEVDFPGETEKERFSQFVHWGYGTGWGAIRGVLEATGLKGVTGTLAHFLAVWGTSLVILPNLEVAPPVSKWRDEEIVIDVLHHAVYAVGTALAYAYLDATSRD